MMLVCTWHWRVPKQVATAMKNAASLGIDTNKAYSTTGTTTISPSASI